MNSPVRICQACGRSIPADVEFCPHCGARNEKPGRSALETLLDWFFTGLVVVVALLFGLAGACFLLVTLTGIAESPRNPNALLYVIVTLALGIGFLIGALNLIRYVRRRRAAQKPGL